MTRILVTSLAAMLLLSANAHAAKMEATLLWKYDVRVANENIYVVDLQDGMNMGVIADGPRSGVVHALKSDGTLLWKYGTGTYFYDSYATNPDDRGAFLVIGMFRNVYAVDSNGKSVWRRSLMSEDARSVYAADVNNDGLLEYVIGVFSKRGGDFQLVDSNGNLIKQAGLRGMEIPYVVRAVDLDGDGMKEILIGGAKFSVNTVAENYELNPGRGNFYVYDSTGNLEWSTEDGTLSVDAGDINGDGMKEVVVGTASEVIAYSHTGEKMWSYGAKGEVRGLKIADVNNDSAMEVVAGAALKVLLLDSSGKLKSEYKVDTQVAGLDVKDLDGDGKMEVVIASTTIEVINDKFEKLWESDGYAKMTRVIAADINKDTYVELVSGCSDGWIRVFDTAKYAKAGRAASYKALAEGHYDQMRYDTARYYAQNAVALFEDLSDLKGTSDTKSLLEKINARIEADGYYNRSLQLSRKGDYCGASDQAVKANQVYRSLSTSFERIAELNAIIDACRNTLESADYYNKSLAFYQQGNYAEASSNALKAKQLYELKNNTQMANLSGYISNKSLDYLAAEAYFTEAGRLLDKGNTTEGADYLNKSGGIYRRLSDLNGTRKVEERMGGIGTVQEKTNVRTYGFAVIAVAFLLGLILLAGIAIMLVLRSKGGELKLLLGLGEEKPKKGGLFQ